MGWVGGEEMSVKRRLLWLLKMIVFSDSEDLIWDKRGLSSD